VGTEPDLDAVPPEHDECAGWAPVEGLLRFQAQLLDVAGQAVLATDGCGRIRYWNHCAEQLFGYRPEEVLGHPVVELATTASLRSQLALINECRSRHEVWRGEVAIRRGDGVLGRVHVVASPLPGHEPVGTVVVATDLTERVRAEEALRESEERFRSLADDLPLIVWQHDADTRQGFVNRTFCEFFDITRQEMCDGRWRQFLHPEDVAGYFSEFETCVRQRRPFHREARVRRGDGQWRWIESWARPRFSGDGTYLGHIGTSADVTDRRRAQEREHEIALRLQRALLPEDVVRHPGVEISARYLAGSEGMEVGGDWYDTYALTGGRIGISVGDVVGHGLEAAATMGRLRTALAALAPRADGPARMLSELDEFTRGPDGTDYATACCAVLNTATGELRYASAGHLPMLLVSPRGATQWLTGGHSTALCRVAARSARSEAREFLDPGSVVLAYSDGLVERRNEPIDVGLARLEQLARRAWADGDEVLCDRLVAGMSEGTRPQDDTVVVSLRWTGEVGPVDPGSGTVSGRAVSGGGAGER
jgi:PAS domain S-box-containing protein